MRNTLQLEKNSVKTSKNILRNKICEEMQNKIYIKIISIK